MMMDFSTVLMRMINQNRLPFEMEPRLEKIRFESIMTGNYVKAFMLLLLSSIAAMLALLVPR